MNFLYSAHVLDWIFILFIGGFVFFNWRGPRRR